ncbi:MAG TPA: aminopeptidase [Anaerolineales bacterium]
MTSKHEKLLRKYAEVIVKVGLNLQKGQRLIITNSRLRGVSIVAAPLVREVARVAYEAGARYVDVIWSDEELLRIRLQNASRESLGEYPKWQIAAQMDMIEHGDALLTILADDPDLMSGFDSESVAWLQKTHLENYKPVGMAVSRDAINWCLVAASSPAWAAKIFPKLESEKAEKKLWKAIFETTRVDQDDPIAAWEKHIKNLAARAKYLQAKQYVALHYNAPGTDLTLGLPRGHRWISARLPAENGVNFIANLPTEEVFTMPDRMRADGTVSATMPLSYGGSLIEDFSITFENGRVKKVNAKSNEAILKKLIETDEGASHLGEVALVPASSPIAKRGNLFYNTLFDENASCHIAIGRAYRFTLTGGEELTDEEFSAAGGNNSLTHVDFMIGSSKMDIDGIKEDGSREPVMHKGEWVFKA